MRYQVFNKSLFLRFIFSALVFVTVLAFNFNSVYADVPDCSGSLIGTAGNDNPPSLDKLFCPVVRVFNAAILLVGAILVIMIIYGAIKLALSLGDPKGFESAKATWLYAGIGLGIILGFWGLLTIIMNRLNLGDTYSGPLDPFLRAMEGIQALLAELGITSSP